MVGCVISEVLKDLCLWFVSADVMVGMGYNLEEIQDSLAKMKYDEIIATYLLLGRKASEVQTLTYAYLNFTGRIAERSKETNILHK